MRPGPRVNVQQLQLRRIDVGGNALALAKYAVERHPVKLSLNFLGLALLFLVPGFTPSETQEAAYMRLSPSSDLIGKEREAYQIMRNAEYTYKQSQGWFWSCDQKCQRHKYEYEDDKREWERQHHALEAQMTRAKSELGVFSKYSFEEAREAFWGSFNRGMAYAKRSTMWDALFVGIRWSMSRDETMVNFVIQMVIRLISNLSIGIVSAVISFWWQAWGIIKSFGPSSIGFLVFFLGTLVAGAAFAATAIGVMVGTTVAGLATINNVAVTAMENQQRLGAGGGRHHQD